VTGIGGFYHSGRQNSDVVGSPGSHRILRIHADLIMGIAGKEARFFPTPKLAANLS
jgi:hypothetical protein